MELQAGVAVLVAFEDEHVRIVFDVDRSGVGTRLRLTFQGIVGPFLPRFEPLCW